MSAEREAFEAEIARLVNRVERLRGLCKTAVGMLRDAECDRDADRIAALIGDMEGPPRPVATLGRDTLAASQGVNSAPEYVEGVTPIWETLDEIGASVPASEWPAQQWPTPPSEPERPEPVARLDAHELWEAAQLVPGEDIEDGVDRISSLLAARSTWLAESQTLPAANARIAELEAALRQCEFAIDDCPFSSQGLEFARKVALTALAPKESSK